MILLYNSHEILWIYFKNKDLGYVLSSLAIQSLIEIIANNTEKSLLELILPLLTGDLINTPPCAYIAVPFAVSAPFDIALPRHGFEGFF